MMDDSRWRTRLRGTLIAVGALLLGVPMFYLEADSTRGLAASAAGFLIMMAGLYSWKRAADSRRSRRRKLLADVGGEAEVAAEDEELPRRDPFEDLDR